MLKLYIGIGLSVADRLLTEHQGIHICLACRNTDRAKLAKTQLLQRHVGADISLLTVDTSSVDSVFKAAQQIMERYSRLDYLFLNAGIMPVSSINWDQVAAIFSRKGAKILTTGCGALNLVDGTTHDGLQNVFATNLFGHFVMVRELEGLLGRNSTTQIIWTSSLSAHKDAFSIDNIQHVNGQEPYSSSKYATDAVSITLNERLNQQGVYSHVTAPGLVLSNLTFSILPSWFWLLVLPFLYFMRIFVPSLTCSAYNGAESLIWLTRQRPESLDPRSKYCSRCSVFFQRYVNTKKLDVSDTLADQVYKKLDSLYMQFKKNKKTNGGIQNGFHASLS